MHRCFWFPLALSLISASAAAQPLPAGIAPPAQASAGKTDVAKGGFQEAPKREEDKSDAASAEVSAGGLIASGNSRQIALTSAAKARVRSGDHQGFTAGAINFAMASSAEQSDLATTVENLQGQLRYDYFFDESWSGFLSVAARRDRFQGLDLRLNIDPGVAFYAVNDANHQLWFELGYDLQYDVRDEAAVANAEAETMTQVDGVEARHGARAFLGYSNKLNERVTVDSGLEYIQSVEESRIWRLNWNISMTSNIAGAFSTAAAMSVRYDHAPLAGIEKTDILTSFNLVYSVL